MSGEERLLIAIRMERGELSPREKDLAVRDLIEDGLSLWEIWSLYPGLFPMSCLTGSTNPESTTVTVTRF